MKSAKRVLDLLELVADHPAEYGLAQVSKELGLPRSTAHLLARYLESRGYLRSFGDRTFGLGVKSLELGGRYSASVDLIAEFQLVARQLVAESGETIQMAVLDGREVIYIGKQDGNQPVRLASSVGRRLPASCTALGKALLASLPDQEIEQILGDGKILSASTPKSMVSTEALRQDLLGVRQLGFAHDNEEMTTGVQCMAAPVLDSSGKVVAAMSVSVVTARITPERMRYLVGLITRGAQEVSARIGFFGAWAPYGNPVQTVETPDHLGVA